ncbi:hypothetical protein N7474_003872 [Penicillium riverlandense]|uniref:uncharacterized protein n=1 Tax=Penicillium riverlandense TaxID=1903569 RepID=UPI002547E222|nr:uncharacterized protein N7474_003872 [Penicillium riverlandense]KAJ5818281.1 hypothetical protein N7474_003872 [Penicillium riverlandense]
MPEDDPSNVDITQALADLARGEMTASALENHLNELEGKVEELLAGFEAHGQSTANAESNAGDHSTNQEPQNDSTSAK